MRKRSSQGENFQPYCKCCRSRYSLMEAVRKADRNRSRDLRCPHCGSKTGKV
jgi:transcription initiation factor IIE alpha subunit